MTYQDTRDAVDAAETAYLAAVRHADTVTEPSIYAAIKEHAAMKYDFRMQSIGVAREALADAGDEDALAWRAARSRAPSQWAGVLDLG